MTWRVNSASRLYFPDALLNGSSDRRSAIMHLSGDDTVEKLASREIVCSLLFEYRDDGVRNSTYRGADSFPV